MSILSLSAQVAPEVSGAGFDPLVLTFILGGVLAIALLWIVLRDNADFDDLGRPGAD